LKERIRQLDEEKQNLSKLTLERSKVLEGKIREAEEQRDELQSRNEEL